MAPDMARRSRLVGGIEQLCDLSNRMSDLHERPKRVRATIIGTRAASARNLRRVICGRFRDVRTNTITLCAVTMPDGAVQIPDVATRIERAVARSGGDQALLRVASSSSTSSSS